MAQATNEQLLEAAKSGDYSELMNTPDFYGQIPANMSNKQKNRILSSYKSAGEKLLKVENAMQGVNTGDYSGASRDNQMLYSPEIGGQVDYNRTLGQGADDPDGGNTRKGYAVLDQTTDADGNQYLAVSGRNSSFIVKINPDGTHEREETTGRKKGKR